jgi:hypothetical protein
MKTFKGLPHIHMNERRTANWIADVLAREELGDDYDEK